MTKSLLEKKILEETKGLSISALAEILEYIRLLKTKKGEEKKTRAFDLGIESELSALDKTSLFHLEEEFANYKDLYPRER